MGFWDAYHEQDIKAHNEFKGMESILNQMQHIDDRLVTNGPLGY